jgi:hypothetical protein
MVQFTIEVDIKVHQMEKYGRRKTLMAAGW